MNAEEVCREVAEVVGSDDELSTVLSSIGGMDSLLPPEVVGLAEDCCGAIMPEGHMLELRTVGDVHAFVDARNADRSG